MRVAIGHFSFLFKTFAGVNDEVPGVVVFRRVLLRQQNLIIIGAVHAFNLVFELISCIAILINVNLFARFARMKFYRLIGIDLHPNPRDVPVDLVLAHVTF